MNRLRKIFPVFLIVVIISIMTTFYKRSGRESEGMFMKDFTRVGIYKETIPANYEVIDWKEKAVGYDQLVFNTQVSGTYLPLMWMDTTYQSFGLPAYIGDGRMHQDGAQEAVTNIAAIVSGTLMGIDKSNQDGVNYVEQINAFFSEKEQIVLNNPAGSSETTSMWYLLYPALLYTHVSFLYPDELLVRENTLKNIESWYQAYKIMFNDGEADFDYTGFNFKLMEPYRNDVWKEPDSAVGIAMLMYYGYELTGDEKYIEAAIQCMNYIESYSGSPQYEALMYYAPYLASKLNAEYGTTYDITKSLNRVFDGSSIPRGGWGSIVGTWGNYPMDGLFGSTTDGGGYAFAMNTFAAAGALVPLVQYDQRYASAIGKWMLHAVSNSRYYFADQTNDENQSCTYDEICPTIDERIKTYIPYEGIRKESNGRTPWFGGDPTVYGWAKTDFSLYSGAHIGIFASLIEETNIPSLLKINLTATQFNESNAYPAYLMYNPHEEVKSVNYKPINSNVDLYNLITNEVIHSQVSDEVVIEIGSLDSVVIVELPANSSLVNKQGTIYVEDKYISREIGTLSVKNYQNNDEVSKKINLDLSFLVNEVPDELEVVEVTIDNVTLKFEDTSEVTIHTNEFSSGMKKIDIFARSNKGFTDQTTIRLMFK